MQIRMNAKRGEAKSAAASVAVVAADPSLFGCMKRIVSVAENARKF